jgi:multicomponent Na+:H+ antiporter subunit E
MNYLTINAFMALLWAALTGSFDLSNVAAGFALAYAILYFAQPVRGQSVYFRKTKQTVAFLGYVIFQIVKSNFKVAHDILTPTHYMRPGIIAVPLDARTDLEITLFANFLSLTPGTLSMDVSEDRSVLYVHAMYLDEDPDHTRSEIKRNYERPVLELLRSEDIDS